MAALKRSVSQCSYPNNRYLYCRPIPWGKLFLANLPKLVHRHLGIAAGKQNKVSSPSSGFWLSCCRREATCVGAPRHRQSAIHSNAIVVSRHRRKAILTGRPREPPPDRIWIAGVVRTPSSPFRLDPDGFGLDPAGPGMRPVKEGVNGNVLFFRPVGRADTAGRSGSPGGPFAASPHSR
jgi:hypothetical protein